MSLRQGSSGLGSDSRAQMVRITACKRRRGGGGGGLLEWGGEFWCIGGGGGGLEIWKWTSSRRRKSRELEGMKHGNMK